MTTKSGPQLLDGLKKFSRDTGFTSFYDLAWRHPLREFGALMRDGGPLERRRTAAGHEDMRQLAATLPALAVPNTDNGHHVHMLTGRRFWHQSVYCMASLQLACTERITPVFYSDGSLDDAVRQSIANVLPWARFVTVAEIEDNLETTLPKRKYPTLRARRIEYIHLRKLVDIHSQSKGWKLVLDSDMLFFRQPEALLRWFGAPHLVCMSDVRDNYGYPPDYLASLAGAKLPGKFNVGLYGMNSDTIDWDLVEHWCSRQLAEIGPSYLQEQGLTAMIAAGREVRVLPADEYVLLPNVREGKSPKAVMHHYVDYSKRSYFQYAWRIIDRKLREERPACS